MTTDFTTLFVNVDDCWKAFEKIYAKHLIEDGTRKRNRQNKLSISEIMTILIAFQTSGYRTFKDFYQYILAYHRHDFPDMVSYDRFIYLMPRAIAGLVAYTRLPKKPSLKIWDVSCQPRELLCITA